MTCPSCNLIMKEDVDFANVFWCFNNKCILKGKNTKEYVDKWYENSRRKEALMEPEDLDE